LIKSYDGTPTAYGQAYKSHFIYVSATDNK